jgi:putative mRNA 3-end processing factor
VLIETPAGLHCPDGDFYIDPWGPVPRAVITHAHGDHARAGSSAYLCASDCAPLLARRLGTGAVIEPQPYAAQIALGNTRVSFHPAGHILGSAQIRIEGPQGVWVVSGDFKREADPTCLPFEPLQCNTFVTESTFGLPIYCWDAPESVVRDIVSWWDDNRARNLTSVLFCYTLGKAQRLLAELRRFTDRPVLVHGMMLQMIDAYRAAGIEMAATTPLIERPKGSSTAGELVLAPLSARGTPWMRRLGEISDGFVSGLMRVRGVRRQRGFDRGFVLSDHADWPGLLQTVVETGASRVLATHGHAEPLARFLAAQGRETGVLRTAWEGEAGAEEANG